MSPMDTDLALLEAMPVRDTVVAREMARLWPNLFGPGDFVPLEINIDKILADDAQRRGSELTLAKIRLFLELHLRRPLYLMGVLKGGPRHSIIGVDKNSRQVTPADAEAAAEIFEDLMEQVSLNGLPSRIETIADDQERMAWWSGLDREGRAKWVKASVDSGIGADAWTTYKIALSTLGDPAERA